MNYDYSKVVEVERYIAFVQRRLQNKWDSGHLNKKKSQAH